MTLTHDILKLGYYWAGRAVGRQRHIDHQDIAHEAFLRVMRRTKPVPDGYLSNYIRLVVKAVYREYYTNKTDRKHNVLLGAVRMGVSHDWIYDDFGNDGSAVRVWADRGCQFRRQDGLPRLGTIGRSLADSELRPVPGQRPDLRWECGYTRFTMDSREVAYELS